MMADMLPGTRKLFPTDYERFKIAMLNAAGEGDLPIRLQLADIKDFTLKDVQDLFVEFQMETGLEMAGFLTLSDETGMLELQLEIDHPENPGKTVLQ